MRSASLSKTGRYGFQWRADSLDHPDSKYKHWGVGALGHTIDSALVCMVRQERAVHQGVAAAPVSQSLLLARDSLGAAAFIATAAFVCYFLITKLWGLLGGAGASGGGRLVRDRSMGGKPVFIPNQPLQRPQVSPRADHTACHIACQMPLSRARDSCAAHRIIFHQYTRRVHARVHKLPIRKERARALSYHHTKPLSDGGGSSETD